MVILSNLVMEYLGLETDESSKRILRKLAEREATLEEYVDVLRFLMEILYKVTGKKRLS